MIIDDMESFLPSEIARLVYGYLEEETCMTAAQAFLESSGHLQECLDVARKGRKFNTRILGRNLIGLLDMLSEVASLVKEYTIEVGWEAPARNKLDQILRVLQLDGCLEKCARSSVKITSTSHDFDPPTDGTVENLKKPDHHSSDNHQFSINGTDCSPGGNRLFNNVAACHDVQPAVGPLPASNDKQQEMMSDVLMNMKTDIYSDVDPIGIPDMESTTVCEEDYKSTGPPSVQPNLHQHQVHQLQQMQQQQPPIVVHMVGTQQSYAPNSTINTTAGGMPTTVYMTAVSHRPEHNHMQFQPNTVQPIVSCPTTVSTSHPPLWTNSQEVPMFRNVVQGVSGMDQQQKLQQQAKGGRKRIRNSGIVRPRVVPKLRPIAPKITRTLENGIEVQVVHTKETPLIDLAETIPSVVPTRRSQRSKKNLSSSNSSVSNNACVNNTNAKSTKNISNWSSPSDIKPFIPNNSANPPLDNNVPPDIKPPPSPGKPPPSPIFIDIHSLDLKR